MSWERLVPSTSTKKHEERNEIRSETRPEISRQTETDRAT